MLVTPQHRRFHIFFRADDNTIIENKIRDIIVPMKYTNITSDEITLNLVRLINTQADYPICM
jgi:hypothetical protein